jgi:hypothetical protein
VVVCPLLDRPLARKTATLYAALTADDFVDGREVAAQAALLRSGAPLDPHLLGNAFARRCCALRPELAEIPALLRRSGAPWWPSPAPDRAIMSRSATRRRRPTSRRGWPRACHEPRCSSPRPLPRIKRRRPQRDDARRVVPPTTARGASPRQFDATRIGAKTFS